MIVNIRGNDIKKLYSRINISKFQKLKLMNLWNKRKMFGLPSWNFNVYRSTFSFSLYNLSLFQNKIKALICFNMHLYISVCNISFECCWCIFISSLILIIKIKLLESIFNFICFQYLYLFLFLMHWLGILVK